MDLFKNLYQYRELLKTSIKKEIRGKYKGSFLGILWSFLNPLLQVLVYWIVFPYLFRGATIDNYLLYLVTGVIPWNFFISTVIGATGTIKANGGIIKKVYFPREILIISQVFSGLINFFISCSIILLFCIITGAGLSYLILLVPLIAIIQTILNLGLGFILGAINVYIQDIENVVQFILNMGFYGTPILYSLSQFKTTNLITTLIQLNPLTTIINSYRCIFLYHTLPNIVALSIVFCISCVIMIAGFIIFKKLEKGFAEQL